MKKNWSSIVLLVLLILLSKDGSGQILKLHIPLIEGAKQYAINAGATRASIRKHDQDPGAVARFEKNGSNYDVVLFMPRVNLWDFSYTMNGEEKLSIFPDGGA